MLSRKERLLYLVAFPAGHGAVDWGSGAFWILAPAIALAMDLSPTQVGLLFAMRQVGSGVAQLPAGLTGDSLRRRGTFLLSTFWWVAIAQLAASVAPGYWTLGVFLAIAGAGAAAWHPVAMGTMVQRMPDRRAFALAIHSIGGTVAEIIAPLIVGFLLVFLEWRQVLQIGTLPAIVMGLLFIRLSSMVVPSVQGNISIPEVRELSRRAMRPATLGILLVLVLQNMSIIALMSMTPLYLQEERGFSSGLSGVAFAALVVSGAALAPLVGRVSDRAGRKPIALAGFFGGGASAWLVTVAPGTVGVFAALAATGFLLLTIRPVVMATALEVVGRREATVLGFLSAIGEGIAALGAALAGLVGEADLGLALVFAGGLSTAAGLAAGLHPFAPARSRREILAE